MKNEKVQATVVVAGVFLLTGLVTLLVIIGDK